MSARARAAWTRGALFLAFWVALIGLAAADFAVGVVAAAAATWTSLYLQPPGRERVNLGALCRFFPRFLGQSLLAGWDVARRAFDPRLPLRPGFISFAVVHPPGHLRNTFSTITSLLPGAVPCGDEDGSLVYHCLDVGQPVAQQLALEEKVLAQALGGVRRDG